jgi:hypothetical protein
VCPSAATIAAISLSTVGTSYELMPPAQPYHLIRRIKYYPLNKITFMKKNYVLCALLVMLASACKKETAPKQENEKFKPTNFSTPFFASPGTGATVALDPADGQYKASYNGVNLVFSPVPTNTNYQDKDPGQAGMSCTNCVEFLVTGDYFTAIIGVLPSSYLDDIHTKLTKYAQDFNDFTSSAKFESTNTYKQPTSPEYPTFNYYATVTGVVVRSHSSPSSLAIYPATVTPNYPKPVTSITEEIGGIRVTDGTEVVYYDIFMDHTTHQITNVVAVNQSTFATLPNISWSGAVNVTGSGITQTYHVTLKVFREGVKVIDVTDFTALE